MSQSIRPEISLLENDAKSIQCPPSDLLSDEPPLETDFHRDQIDLLIRLLKCGSAIAMIFMCLEI